MFSSSKQPPPPESGLASVTLPEFTSKCQKPPTAALAAAPPLHPDEEGRESFLPVTALFTRAIPGAFPGFLTSNLWGIQPPASNPFPKMDNKEPNSDTKTLTLDNLP